MGQCDVVERGHVCIHVFSYLRDDVREGGEEGGARFVDLHPLRYSFNMPLKETTIGYFFFFSGRKSKVE